MLEICALRPSFLQKLTLVGHYAFAPCAPSFGCFTLCTQLFWNPPLANQPTNEDSSEDWAHLKTLFTQNTTILEFNTLWGSMNKIELVIKVFFFLSCSSNIISLINLENHIYTKIMVEYSSVYNYRLLSTCVIFWKYSPHEENDTNWKWETDLTNWYILSQEQDLF
jgi:hypothetical protein